jgi:macrolide phosphotransferase
VHDALIAGAAAGERELFGGKRNSVRKLTTLADDLDSVATAIERRFPDLRPARPLRVVGRGFRSVAVETAGGVVVLVGRSVDAAEDYAREWRVGPFLSERLGSIVPRPQWYAPPCDDFPHGVLAYQKLSGETPEWGIDPGRAFARDLGAFMARLHAIDVSEAINAGVPQVDAYGRMLGARDVVTPVLRDRLERAQLVRIEAWWEEFASDDRMRSPRIAVCHDDLWHDNLLRSDDGRLSGVLDIAHVELTDPAHDFAAPRYFGDAAMRELIAAYRDAGGRFDDEDAQRAQSFFEAREFGGLAWAIEHDDGAEIEDSLKKIKGRLTLLVSNP